MYNVFTRSNKEESKMSNQAKIWGKEEISNLLKTSDTAILRGVIAIYNKQTRSEKEMNATIVDNGVGFSGGDGMIGTFHGNYIAKWGIERAYVKEKILPYWKQLNAKGKMRIEKYAGQLAKIANKEI